MNFRDVVAAVVIATTALTPRAQSVAAPPRAGEPFHVVPLGDSVYAIIRDEPLAFAVHANNLVIVCDSDVVVVDSDFTRAAATEVIAAIRRITPKPVRYLVNTHWHDDHVMGNQAYEDAFPGIQFIAHAATKDGLLHDAVENRKQQLAGAPQALEYFRNTLRDGKSLAGGALGAEERAAWESTIAIVEQYLREAPTARPMVPSITFDDQFTLRRGSRTIEIRFLGLGNTKGDAIVYLPKERIVASGDLVVAPIPFTFNANIGPWIGALDRLRALQATTLVPGHGPVMHDDAYLRQVQRLLGTIAKQADDAVARGDSLAAARKAIDLTEMRQAFAGESQLLRILFGSFVSGPAVTQAFNEATARRSAAARPAPRR